MPVSIENGHSIILTGRSSGLEPTRKGNFTVEIQDGAGTQAPTDVNYVVKSFDPPAKSVEVKSVRFANHVKTYPAERSALGEAALVLRCMGRKGASPAYRFFEAWFKTIYNPDTDSVGLIGDATMGRVTLVPMLPQATEFGSVVLENAWPSSIKMDGGDRDDDGNPLNFTVVFHCNDVHYTFEG